MKRKHKRLLLRIVISAILMAGAYLAVRLVSMPLLISIALFMIPYLLAAYDVLLKALVNIRHGQIFDENFLMCIATVGAFVIGEYPEAVFVMVFYQTGELFQSIAVGKSRRSIASLMDIKPDEARVIRNGEAVTVLPEDVAVGETVVIRAGEKLPLDGTVIHGAAELDCRALTGESIPRTVSVGDKVTGGCISLNGELTIEVSSSYEDSTVSKIIELVENAASSKARTDRFITRFARFYTPFVVACAFIVFLVPSLAMGDWRVWLGRALVFLVISCPCALVISVPLSYFGGIGAASKRGILIKGACYLESLAESRCVVFDKTGTLTKGSFKVCGERCFSDVEELYSVALSLEERSNHPVAKAVAEHCFGAERIVFESVTEIAGMGITGEYNGVGYFAGNARLAEEYGIKAESDGCAGSVILVGKEGMLLGSFTVSDIIKETAYNAITVLSALGVERTVMLSGDKKESVERRARELGIGEAIGELLPSDKVKAFEGVMSGFEGKGRVVYVGDGINDAPVLSRSDIGISMGMLGSDAAIEAADVVIMDDDPIKVSTAIRIAKATKRIVIENISFALGVKVLFMVLGVFGVGLWAAVFADVGVSVIAILNAMRALRSK